ncbi:cellulose binding domain-containing protein [Cellvibrio mixtus]|uniref:cellulose binding domain-containing protein n=1 Tax=Cellvibrio mixtus TaxID=39650 RepID=UPI0005880386|nr:cellulose binding domain-containing protein [Cellvibrio mixtus]
MKISILKKNSLLKKSLVIATLSALALPVFALSPPPTSPFWKVQDGKLLDPNGKPFVFRGVTVEQNLAPAQALQAIKDAATLGANAVQVEINGNLYRQETMITGEQLSAIIKTCKESKVVCVLEPNDVAGYPDAAGAGIPATAANFWGWPGIREAIDGQQSYIILGFGNQYLGPMPQQEYIARMLTYLGDFSYSTLSKFIIMVDGSNWGQDADKAMYEFARQYPSNGINRPYLLYSVDMFDAFTTPQEVHDYIASFAEIKAPLVIGGFARTPYYHPHNQVSIPHVALQLPAEAVMQYAEQYGVGYFGWSWSGNKNPALDVVTNWDPNSLTDWGNLLFNDVNGIKATAKTASIYGNTSSNSSSSFSSSSVPDKSSSSIYSSSSIRTSSSSSIRTSSSSSIAQTKAQCSYQIQSQWGNGFTASIRIKNISNTVINGWDVNWQYTDGSKITNLWNANLSGANPYSAKNLNWNSAIQPGQTIEFGFQGSKNSAAASIPIVTGNICQ